MPRRKAIWQGTGGRKGGIDVPSQAREGYETNRIDCSMCWCRGVEVLFWASSVGSSGKEIDQNSGNLLSSSANFPSARQAKSSALDNRLGNFLKPNTLLSYYAVGIYERRPLVCSVTLIQLHSDFVLRHATDGVHVQRWSRDAIVRQLCTS